VQVPDLPPEIGPHEGREFELMRAGLKRVAFFSDFHPDGLEEFLKDASFALLEEVRHYRDKSFIVRIVYHRQHEDIAQELMDLTRDPPKGWVPAY
jgi:hypothetical protein